MSNLLLYINNLSCYSELINIKNIIFSFKKAARVNGLINKQGVVS